MEFECLLPGAIKGRSSSRFYSYAFTGRLRSLKTRWLCLNTRFTRRSSCSSRLWTRKRENGIRQWIGFTTSKRKTRFYGILKISCKLIYFESFGRCNWTIIASSYHTSHHVTKKSDGTRMAKHLFFPEGNYKNSALDAEYLSILRC